MKRLVLTLLVVVSLAACGDDSPGLSDADTTDAPPTEGQVNISWTLSDGTSAITCPEVGGLTVSLQATPQNGAFGSVDPFSCGVASGTSRRLLAGTYNIEVDLRTGGSRSLLAAPIVINDVVVTVGGNVTLDPIIFTVIPQGSLAFRIDSDQSGDNCAGMVGGGAGITDFRFELRDSNGTCQPATFDIAAGGQAAGTYTTVCAPVAFGACIENDQDISVATLPSGSYTLVLTGIEAGPFDCYDRISQFTVPGNNLQADLGAVTVSLNSTPDCDINAPDAGPPDAMLPDAT